MIVSRQTSFVQKPSDVMAKYAFTLAEVLITLAIIGVIAALTIPTLINNSQKAQYLTSLKKAYTQFSQVLSQISTDRGCTNDLNCSGLFGPTTGTLTKLGDEITKYFNVSKNCGVTPSQGCFATNTNAGYDGPSYGVLSYDSTGLYKFITTDGVSFMINVNGAWDNCINDQSMGITNNAKQFCADVTIDVNGPIKGPNAFGRDTFIFAITNGKGILLYPHGGVDYKWSPWINNSTKAFLKCYPGDKDGQACAGRVMDEGWEMNY